MAARPADAAPQRPRPRPRPPEPIANSARALARATPAPTAQLVTTAGGAVVTAARVGRLLGRSGWRLARQLPGMTVVEHRAQRLRQGAVDEMYRLLDMPQHLFGVASPEEQRVMMLVQGADSDPAPLRTAMTELLHRSSESTGPKSRDYLFGTIISQLVPDEARVLAALARDERFAAVDVVARHGRSATRVVLRNASTVGAAAGISQLQNVSTYLTRLQGFGLLDIGPADDATVKQLGKQYDALEADQAVRDARAGIEKGRLARAAVTRRSVALSPLGREFWAACAPAR